MNRLTRYFIATHSGITAQFMPHWDMKRQPARKPMGAPLATYVAILVQGQLNAVIENAGIRNPAAYGDRIRRRNSCDRWNCHRGFRQVAAPSPPPRRQERGLGLA